MAVLNEVLWTQAQIIDDYGCGTHGNWGTMERTFLAYLAVCLPGARRHDAWVEKAVECLDVTILQPCSPDGGWPEPPGYAHWGMLKGMELIEVIGRAGATPDKVAEWDRKLRRMMEYQWRLMKSDDQLPAIGDGWYVFRNDIYMAFARRYQKPEWAAACLRHGWRPAGRDLLHTGLIPEVGDLVKSSASRPSDNLPHDGYALFRDGQTQLTMFYGYQSGHGHFDTLSFMLYAHGQDFISEHVADARIRGTGYGSRWDEKWTRASRSHCMLMVDDETWSAQTPGKCLLWDANTPGKSHGIFQAPAYPGVTVTREVVQDGGAFDLTDTIQGGPHGGQRHTWRAMFPSSAEIAREGRILTVTLGGKAVRIDPSKLDDDVEIILDTAPPEGFSGVEEITQRGKMLLLARKIQADQKTVFRVRLEVVP
jgi:hypothetical protein